LSFIPVKRQQLAASAGTTPFDGLFLGLSFFIIAAALLLVALLFRLGVEQRADEVGALLAVGLRRKKVSRLLVAEGGLVAAAGGLVGTVVGIAYAWLMLQGLRTWWVGAITTPFLNFHWTPKSLAIGYVLGVVVSLLTIIWSVRRMKDISVRRLLAGDATHADDVMYKPQRWLTITASVVIVIAIGLAVVAVGLGGMAQAGAFLGGGALLLTGLLLFVWTRLKSGGGRGDDTFSGGWALTKLALRNAARNPGRSVTTIGLMATASFLIVGLSSFRLAPSEAGAGGFDLVAQSSEAIFEDLNTQAGREELLADQADVLAGGLGFAFRFKPGDDASCNNLYRSTQPRVIGVGSPFVEHFDADDVKRFRWMKTQAKSDDEKRNPWHLLASREGEHIPVIIDMNTAMYSLKPPVSVGSKFTLTYDNSNSVSFHVVGLLENSVLQGSLLIDEEAFKETFEEVSGYRYFLIQSPPGKSREVTELLEDRLGDQGFDAVQTSQVLEQLFAVQNTYLSTFQSLGALGLLLGTFGLAAVQMRNVLERRGELALLRATGFKRRRLARMVMLENILLLVGGLATGTIAALLAVLPHKFTGDASIPADLLRDLGLMLLAVLVVGLLSSVASVRASLRVPVLAALRGE
jgi:ABC-type antimicrobial peptide transport system permease subunit